MAAILSLPLHRENPYLLLSICGNFLLRYLVEDAGTALRQAGRSQGRGPNLQHLSSSCRAVLCAVAAAILFVPFPVHAAAPGEALRFHRYTQEDGLVQNTVVAIAQDHHGFLWFGTEDGLHRFDGYEMAVYQARPGDEAGLQADGVYDLLVDAEGDLWIATYGGGVSELSASSGAFRHFRHDPANPHSLNNDAAFELALNPDGRIWVVTVDGLDLLDPASGHVQHFPAGEATGLGSDAIWSVFVDSKGVAWVGAQNGLFVYRPETQDFELFRAGDTAYAMFHDHTISAMAEAPDGNLLVATKAGLHELDGRRDLVRSFGASAFGLAPGTDLALRRILVTSQGEIWVSSFSGGTYWWDEKAQQFRNYRHDPADPWSISDDVVLSMLEDETGIVWFGTETGGVNRFNPATRAFHHFRHHRNQPNSLPNRVVWAVMEDRRGRLWIGTDGGLSRLDRQRGEYRHYLHDADDERSLPSPFVLDVLEDSQGRIWVGTFEGVALLEDAAGGQFRRFRFTDGVEDEFFANSVSFLFEDRDYIWVGTAEGLFRLDPASGEYEQFLHKPVVGDATAANLLTSATPARKGGWWLGSENGVVRFDTASGTFHESLTARPNGPLSHPFAFDVLEARDGTLWVATDYQLNRVASDGAVSHVGIEQGLPSNTIYSVLEDGEGALWIATNNGLAAFDPHSGEVHVFDVTDGLQANEFNSGAKFRSPAGEMFFGGINGFNAFFPSNISFETRPPTIAITKFFKFNEEVALGRPIPAVESLSLSWRDSVVGFEFAVFDFAAPAKNRFRYRLEGFDTQWLESVGHNHVTYTNLDPGEYVLRVQGANRHGIWSENEATLTIEVAPPPWRTWWAYALYVLTALALFTVGLRLHFVRLAEKHQLENEQHKRRWAETLQQLTQALAGSLDGREIAEELLENLRSMVAFRKAVLFVEQGVEIHVAGSKGIRDDQLQALQALPAHCSRFFAEIRHARKPRVFTRHDVHMPVLHDDMASLAQFVAVPAYSRADEFALLLIGRDAPPFSEQERGIISAFLTQALVALDNARLFAEVQNLATTDTLTQVHNRRYFFELAELEFARSKRYGRDVALVLLDADNFKSINDHYGREIGDRVLKIIANCCRNNLRHFDIIGRYGGEDFVIMLPETPMNVAADVADRLRKSIESIRVDTHKGELTVTVSVGVAVATESTPDLPALINRADMALYEAKKAGRNKVVVAER